MKHIYTKITLALMAIIICSLSSFAQQGKPLWTKITESQAIKGELAIRKVEPSKADFYQLDIDGLRQSLQAAPNRKTFLGESQVIVKFPNADGNLESFRIKEASIMEEALQQQFPNMRSYIGQSMENPINVIRFSVTPKGINTMTFTERGTHFVDPFTEDGNFYMSYSKSDLAVNSEEWVCDYVDEVEDNSNRELSETSNRNANDGLLREFRLALACTVEYSQFHGGTLAGVMAAMTNTMTRVNGVYERELSITMVMISNTSIIFLGPNVNSDPYTNEDGGAMLTQNQTTINANIGSANYDIGHVFSTGGGGIAALNSPCTGVKAQGVTGLPTPIGDAFDVDFVCHEMGHQYGGPHTFNGNAPGTSCLTQRAASNAYEPGSGSTIMAYAGICPPQNVQNFSDDYFHQKSLDEIFDNITNGNSQCANLIAIANAAPTANAGGNFTIPGSTPYRLLGTATDDDGPASLTYTWEQYDLGPTGAPLETTVLGPIVRSFKGTNDPTRYIPRLEDLIISGGSTAWEKLASVNRNLNFRLTVRDNDVDGGQTDVDAMLATVNAAAGPFVVTSQNTEGISWVSGGTETITWNVAGTTANGINTANVNILLSIDGGLNYDTILVANVPNDGSQDITVPSGLSSGACRVMVEAVGNIFFNINSTDFSLNATTTTECNTYTTGPIATAIPDSTGENVQGTPVFIPVTVTENTEITDIRVSVDVTHSWIGDLLMQLQAPNSGGFANLWQRTCNDAQYGNVNVTFKDGEPIIVCASPTVGTYAPAFPMTAFTGNNPSGTWNLVFVDFFNGDTGVVNEWSIELCTTTTVLGVEQFSLENTLSVYPNPNNGEFNIKFNASSSNVAVQVFDIRGRSVFNTTFDNGAGEFNETINLATVNAGMYLLSINDGGNTVTKKIIVE